MIAVLNRRSEEDSDYEDDEDDDPQQLKLSRLKLALKYDQKQVYILSSTMTKAWRSYNALIMI